MKASRVLLTIEKINNSFGFSAFSATLRYRLEFFNADLPLPRAGTQRVRRIAKYIMRIR